MLFTNIPAARSEENDSSLTSFFKPNEELAPFLATSAYCNFLQEPIQELARDLAIGASSANDIALKSFYWVRDNITYEVGQNGHSCVETLFERRGSCTNKANLLIALLRANRIPAAYRTIRVKTKDYFGPTNTARFRKFLSDTSYHVFSSVFLNGRWVLIDASDDFDLSTNCAHLCPQATLVDFDGENDAILKLDPRTIVVHSTENLAHIDEIMLKKARIPAPILKVFNVYIHFVRKYALAYKDVETLSYDFFEYLEKEHPPLYAFYCTAEQELDHHAARQKRTDSITAELPND